MAKTVKKTYRVAGMHCAGCAANIEKVLSRRQGVASAAVNFAASTVLVEYDPGVVSVDQLRETVENAGFDLITDDDEGEEEAEHEQAEEYRRLKRNTVWAAALALPVFVTGMFFMHEPWANWVMLAFTVPVLFVFGRGFYINAWKQLRHGRANMDTLVAVSTGVSFLFSLFNTFFPEFWTRRGLEPHVYYEAAAVIVALILFGRTLESRAKMSTASAIRKLMGLQPKTVVRIGADGREEVIAVKDVEEGNTLVVKPGDKIPVDGVVSGGTSFVDESMITGEPVPVEKAMDSEVFAGTINQKGSFTLLARKVGEETLLAQIIRTVREAQGSKAPVQRLVDRIAGIFVPAVLVIALITFCAWMIWGGDDAFSHALLTSVTVLVIACPCALGLATPTAIMVGIGKGAQNNILVKDAESLEKLREVTAIAFDKTGTITEGRPEVAAVHWAAHAGTDRDKSVLYFMESRSEHPLAEAITSFFDGAAAGVEGDVRSETGQGIAAVISGRNYFAGNSRLLEAAGVMADGEMAAKADEYRRSGKTVVFFADGEGALAVIGIADKVKGSSKAAIERLQADGVKTYLLTGDNAVSAWAVAEQVGITDYAAEMMPGDKLEFVRELQVRGEVVAVVGDGINDSGAMAQADVSMAMGRGSDIAMDVAQITLMTSDLASIPKAIKLSRQTVAAIRQNLFWAFIYNVIGIPVAAGVLYPFTGFLLNPMIAAAAMAFSSVSVVANSLRIKAKKL